MDNLIECIKSRINFNNLDTDFRQVLERNGIEKFLEDVVIKIKELNNYDYNQIASMLIDEYVSFSSYYNPDVRIRPILEPILKCLKDNC